MKHFLLFISLLGCVPHVYAASTGHKSSNPANYITPHAYTDPSTYDAHKAQSTTNSFVLPKKTPQPSTKELTWKNFTSYEHPSKDPLSNHHAGAIELPRHSGWIEFKPGETGKKPKHRTATNPSPYLYKHKDSCIGIHGVTKCD